MSYDKLVLARKSCRKCVELVNPADPSHAHLDGAEVGPWSRWLASRPAKLILVGQDWGTVGYYREYNGREIPQNPTNERLKKFLEVCGFAVGPPDQTDRLSGVFATNAILCLKHGRANELSAPVKSKWYSACNQFLKWTIEETSAPVVVALGERAYEAVVRAYGIPLLPFREAVAASPIPVDGPRVLFAVYHPAARPNNRTLGQMRADWNRIAAHLKGLDQIIAAPPAQPPLDNPAHTDEVDQMKTRTKDESKVSGTGHPRHF
jgi:uracil-DNA glycosylase